MNLLKKIVDELNEDTVTSRMMNLSSEQRQELKQIKKDLVDIFNTSDAKIGTPRHNEDFRIQVQNTSIDALWIDTALKTKGYFDLSVIEIQPGENDLGSKSGKYPTIKITTSFGGIIYLVLSGIGKKTNAKQFAPNKFNIEGKDFSYRELYESLVEKIESSNYEENIKQYLLYLLDLVTNQEITKIANVITINKLDFDESVIDKTDKNNIQNDFGEVLGAIVIARDEDDIIYFPKASNEPLIDYEVGNIRYSAKSLSGAAPTLTSMIGYADFVRDELHAPKEEKDVLLQMFEILGKKIGVEQNFLAITKIVDKNAWDATLRLLEVDDLKINESKKAIQIIKDKLDSYYNDGSLNDRLSEYYDTIGTTPLTPIDKYNPKENWRHGFIIGALSYQIPKVLNKNKFHILDHMKEIINQTDGIKQVNFKNNKTLEFKITNFDKNVKVKFVGGGSVTRPNDQNLRFKISEGGY